MTAVFELNHEMLCFKTFQNSFVKWVCVHINCMNILLIFLINLSQIVTCV